MTSSKCPAGYLTKQTNPPSQFTDFSAFSRFGDRDIRESIGAAMDLYSDIFEMQSVTGGATCDAADLTGNDVPIQWTVAYPDDLI